MNKHANHLKLIHEIKERLKKDPVVQESFNRHGISVDEIDIYL